MKTLQTEIERLEKLMSSLNVEKQRQILENPSGQTMYNRKWITRTSNQIKKLKSQL